MWYRVFDAWMPRCLLSPGNGKYRVSRSAMQEFGSHDPERIRGHRYIYIYIYISPPPGRDPPIEFKSPEDSWMEKLFLLSRI